MAYVIIWNHHSHDPHIHLDSHGFVEFFEEKEDAEKEAELCLDKEDFREYEILNDH